MRVHVDSPLARACDVTLDLGDAGLGDGGVSFATSARGEFLQRGNVLAMAFITRADKSFESNPVTIDLPASTKSSATKLSRVDCYDHLGVSIPGAHVSLQ
jgi:hypothetical protein